MLSLKNFEKRQLIIWHIPCSTYPFCCSSVNITQPDLCAFPRSRLSVSLCTCSLIAACCLRGPGFARGSVPQGGSGLKGPRRQARSDKGNKLQMLGCIRAWQPVMSPPTQPRSPITSHLLPHTSSETRRLLFTPNIKDNTSHHYQGGQACYVPIWGYVNCTLCTPYDKDCLHLQATWTSPTTPRTLLRKGDCIIKFNN